MRLKTSFSTCRVKMLRSSSGDGVVSIGTRWALAAAPMVSRAVAATRGSALIFAIPARTPVGMKKFRLELVGRRLGMPELLAPAIGDQACKAEPEQAVQRAGPGKADALDQRPAQQHAERQAVDGEHAHAHHPAAIGGIGGLQQD